MPETEDYSLSVKNNNHRLTLKIVKSGIELISNIKLIKKWEDAYCILAIDSLRASRFSGCFSKYSLTGAR